MDQSIDLSIYLCLSVSIYPCIYRYIDINSSGDPQRGLFAGQLVRSAIDYRIIPGSFSNPVVSVGVCHTAVDAAAGGLTTGWWAVVLECFSLHSWWSYIHLSIYTYPYLYMDRSIDRSMSVYFYLSIYL